MVGSSFFFEIKFNFFCLHTTTTNGLFFDREDKTSLLLSPLSQGRQNHHQQQQHRHVARSGEARGEAIGRRF